MKKILPALLSLIIVAFAQGVYAQGGVLPLNGSLNGNLTSATPDVYTVTTTSDGLLRFTFTTVSPADLYVTLYDNDGTTAVSSAVESYNNSTAVLTVDGLAAGTYKAKITPYNTSFGAYTLADSLFTASLPNDVEPNGSRATAVTLPLNTSKTGHVGYYYNNLRDTADWYKVTTTSDGLLRIYLTTDSGSVKSNTATNPLDVNLTLYDNDGLTLLGNTEVYSGGGIPSTGFITTDGLAPGTYYIKIQNYSTNEFANYKITDSLFTATLANDAEPNGIAATAITLPLNASKTGNVGYYYNHLRDTTDWYKVTTTSNGLLSVYLTTDSGSIRSNSSTNPLDVLVYLYDNDGVTLLGNTEVYSGGGIPATGLISTDGLAAGTYYIKIQSYSTNEFANYKITDSLFTATVANDAEPNGTAATAVTLPLNASKTGNVGYYYNHTRDTADWYKITTTADGLLRVYLSTDSGSIRSTRSTNPLDVLVDLYDNDGVTLLGNIEVYSGGGIPATGLISTDGLAPGTYFIRIQDYSTTEFANYTISDSLFLTRYATDPEPNNSPATAITLPINTSNVKGHIGYYYNNKRDTSDYYKVTTTSSGSLRTILNTSRGSIYSNNSLDFLIYLYSSDGVTLLASKEVYGNSAGPFEDSLVVNGLAAGTYYIKIQTYSASEFGDYSLAVLNSTGVLLPVTFLNFDGILEDNKALLTWRTATELNNKGFEVERSYDGQTFAGIGFVQGHGNSSVVNTYDYTDIKVQSGYNFYRLKQMDIDGNFIYSSTIRLDFKNFAWSILGNPVTASSWVQVQLAKTSKVALQIITSDGRLLQTINKGSLSAGTYSIPLSLGNVASGIYVVRLIVDNTSFSKMVVK